MPQSDLRELARLLENTSRKSFAASLHPGNSTPNNLLSELRCVCPDLPGYILEPSGKVKSVLESTGLPLGVLPDGDFTAAHTPPLEPGELLLLLTDGLVEAHDSDINIFGIDRVFDVVRAHRSRTAREIVDAIYSTVRTFCGSDSQLDDMTAIVIKATMPVERSLNS